VIPRIALLLCGLGALALAFPGPTAPGVVLTAVGAAALAVSLAQPDSAAPALVIGAAATDWLLRGPDGGTPRLVAVAAVLAGVHFSAALASFAPPRAWVDRGVLLRWTLRWAATTAAGVLVVAATELLRTSLAPAWAAAVALVAIGAAAVAGRLLGRPREGGATEGAPRPAPPPPGAAGGSAPR
jgi:hypothetical protein